MLTRIGLAAMRLMAYLPLPLLRGMGALFGWVLYWLAAKRRYIVQTNLRLCFPNMTARAREKQTRAVFTYFAQSWLDRSWLWHGSEAVLAKRLRWHGDLSPLQGQEALVVFAPHFMGLDAGGVALGAARWRDFTSIYSRQSNPQVDAWVLAGRKRFGNLHVVDRTASIRSVVSALRKDKSILYLLPDMDLGGATDDADLFVPFFGVPAATAPSLPRFAQMGRAQVLSMVTVLQPHGYDVQVSAVWQNYPTADAYSDTLRMNQELEALIERYGIAQYYWVHKRFKTRPAGQAGFY